MTIPFQTWRYQVRFAASATDIVACQRLRHLMFYGSVGVDEDQFDAACRHLMVVDQAGRLVATARLFQAGGTEALAGYTAQHYDLRDLAAIDRPMLELGRFCIAQDVMDADVLRLVWATLTRIVDAAGIAFVFGCSSFRGIDPAPYGAAFARLVAAHLGPDGLRPLPKSGQAIALRKIAPDGAADVPSLLRTYLAMGGWVGDHAVVDRNMDTMHVFTCLEVAQVPPSRARVLRALAQFAPLS